MIPKIIHQIWIGPNPIPPACIKYAASWREKHPTFEYRLWTNDNLPPLTPNCQEQFDRYGKAKRWALQADVLRYVIVEQFGGVYLDIDFECYRPIDAYLTGEMFFAFSNFHVHWICNGAFGAEPKHPFFTELVRTLKHEPYHGPIFLSNAVKRHFGLPVGAATSSQSFYAFMEAHNVRCSVPGAFFSKGDHPARIAYHFAMASWYPKKAVVTA